MKIFVKLFLGFFFILWIMAMGSLGGMTSSCAQVPSTADREKAKKKYDVCRGKGLAFQIPCRSSWTVIESEDAVLFKISDEPTVTLTVAKTSSSVQFIAQLTSADLAGTGRYAPGFQMEHVSIGEYKALKVKAFSNDFPEVRLSDYYFIDGGSLWGVFFLVDPQIAWDQYKFVFQDVLAGFRLTGKSPSIKKKNTQ